MTVVIGLNIASSRQSSATTVDLPACRQQLSKSCGCSACSTSICQASGSIESLRMMVAKTERSKGVVGRCMGVGFRWENKFNFGQRFAVDYSKHANVADRAKNAFVLRLQRLHL